ncbi:uncharacterized protein G2W53_037298 [Senna tora]|uniref:Uncharacterized protein n=1 Tax=Senna tora TaxID=362788 RepID=A0A834SX94_9FABA|nr:uncharacterized protein G2W53_037298 [Senna tora]
MALAGRKGSSRQQATRYWDM